MEPDAWMRKSCSNGSPHHEHIAMHVDDLLIVSKTPEDIVSFLQDKCKFKLKGTGPIKHHAGCDFARDELFNLCLPLTNTLRRWLMPASLVLALSPGLHMDLISNKEIALN